MPMPTKVSMTNNPRECLVRLTWCEAADLGSLVQVSSCRSRRPTRALTLHSKNLLPTHATRMPLCSTSKRIALTNRAS
eukprot:6636603-Prymnesium_polylepis.1